MYKHYINSNLKLSNLVTSIQAPHQKTYGVPEGKKLFTIEKRVFVIVLGETLLQNDQSFRYFCF